MKEDVKKLMELLCSWQDENIELAIQLLKGNEELRQATTQLLAPLLYHVDIDLLGINQLPGLIKNKQVRNFPKSDALIPLFSYMPIQNLNLSNASLREFPWWVCYLNELQYLSLNNNSIAIIPTEIKRLQKLRRFSMTRNKLDEIPKEIGELDALEELNFDSNKLVAIPASVGNLSNLDKLQLDFNEIRELPASIGQLSKLSWLCLEANKITTLPKALEGLRNLSWLSIEKTPLGKQHNIKGGFFTSVKSPRFLNLLS